MAGFLLIDRDRDSNISAQNTRNMWGGGGIIFESRMNLVHFGCVQCSVVGSCMLRCMNKMWSVCRSFWSHN